MKLRRVSLVMIACLVLVLLMSTTLLTAQDDVFRVAVVAPSAKDDLAFSQSMYDAMVALKTDMGDAFDFTFQDGTFVPDDAAAALRDWASSGDYNLIIAHGSQFGSVVQEVAADFPETSFAWGTDVDTFGMDNVYAYTVAAEQGGYINGVLAAGLTQTKVIGVIGPIEVGDAKLYVDGFVAGVASVDPEINTLVNYIQDFGNVPLATEAANTFIDNDADVLTGTAQMVVGPIAVAKEHNIPWFGTQSSQAELAGPSGVTFQVYKWDVVLKDMIDQIKAGTLGGEAFTLTLENGGLAMEISDQAFGGDKDKIAATQAQIDSLTEGIVSGDIVIFPEAMMGETETPTPAG